MYALLMARRREPLSPERTERLFATAAREFLRHGFDAASLNRIIADAGMSKSSFYHFFADKADLHEKMMGSFADAVDEYLHPPRLEALDAGSFWPAIGKLLAGVNTMAAERPATVELARLFHALPEGVDPAADRLRHAAKTWIEAALARGAELGIVRNDLPTDLLVEMSLSALIAIDRWALQQSPPAKNEASTVSALQALREFLEGN